MRILATSFLCEKVLRKLPEGKEEGGGGGGGDPPVINRSDGGGTVEDSIYFVSFSIVKFKTINKTKKTKGERLTFCIADDI